MKNWVTAGVVTLCIFMGAGDPAFAQKGRVTCTGILIEVELANPVFVAKITLYIPLYLSIELSNITPYGATGGLL